MLGVRRGPIDGRTPRHAALGRVVLAVTAIQGAHFAEELASGFHRRFPPALGLAPWSDEFFVTFNAFWLAVWLLCGLGLAIRRRVSSFALWFLAIAGMANGVAHPALALRAGGYFPGLATAPVLGLAAWVLWRRLAAATAPRRRAA